MDMAQHRRAAGFFFPRKGVKGGRDSCSHEGRRCGRKLNMAMGHNLWLHFGVDEHPFATCVDVHQGSGF